MRPLFADTFYYLALLSEQDAAHRWAVEISRLRTGPSVTTAWVLTDVADAFSEPEKRSLFPRLLGHLRDNPKVTIVPPSQQLFEQGIELYSRRTDKAWSLTDCISFVVMREMGLSDVLTGDRHFEQAGFRILLGQATNDQ